MIDEFGLDEDVIRRLPLPVAQLCRRAHNAKTPLERHQAAYFLWEASLKLLAAVAITEYAERDEHDPALAERLQNLARPSLGHWWEFVRSLSAVLAADGDSGFAAVHQFLLGRARDDLPRTSGLDAALREVLDGQSGARTTVRVSELFDRMVRYRNRELGHGALGQKSDAFYDRISRTMLAGIAELLGRFDPLAGRRLLHVGDVSRMKSGNWLIEQYLLEGENRRRLRPREVDQAEAASLPRPDRIYVAVAVEDAGRAAGSQVATGGLPASAGTPQSSVAKHAPRPASPADTSQGTHEAVAADGRLVSLHPLLLFDGERFDVLFLNARRGRGRTEYLSYVSGHVSETAELAHDHRELLGRVLGLPVAPQDAGHWADQALGEEQSESSTAAVRDDEPVSAERRIGEFELLSKVGVGGMGDVYRAWQPSLGRQVALKCMRRVGDARAEARFGREIRALGQVEHPHLVKIFTSGAEADRWFYAMEMVEGATLAGVLSRLAAEKESGTFCRNGPKGASHQRFLTPFLRTNNAARRIELDDWHRAVEQACQETIDAEATLTEAAGLSTTVDGDGSSPRSRVHARSHTAEHAPTSTSFVDRSVAILCQIADAAHALHEAGIVHRDVKPENVMIDPSGSRAVLMDLGLAKLSDDEAGRLTTTRQFVGTLRYASPEQVLATGQLDRRSDVYSLGVILWEMLALRPIYRIDETTPTPDLMQRIQYEEPARLRTIQPRTPADLEAIALKCLEKNPARRYATARELIEDLRRWQQAQPVTARKATLAYRFTRRLARHRRLLTIAGLLMAALLAGYLAAADAGVELPGSASVRRVLDRWELSAFRPLYSDAEIREAAGKVRQTVLDEFARRRNDSGWIVVTPGGKRGLSEEVWSQGQSLWALFRAPGLDAQGLAPYVESLEQPFEPGRSVEANGMKFGWYSHERDPYTQAEPALWMAAALAAALARSEALPAGQKAVLKRHLADTHEVLRIYYPLETGGWNMFPQQEDIDRHNVYTTALAFIALLETRRADLPWDGRRERRDALLRATAAWLIARYDDGPANPGWSLGGDTGEFISDGFTLQVYAELLRAERQAGLELPASILANIPRHIERCAGRTLDYPVTAGEFSERFTDHDGDFRYTEETIKMLWHPWAIDCTSRWLAREQRRGAANETLVRLRRVLGHLVVELQGGVVENVPESFSFVLAETLSGFSSVEAE